MVQMPVYLDNHATTRVDPRVVQAMLPYFDEHYGNAGSIGHVFGDRARTAVEQAREQIAALLGASGKEIVFTSGATESNNLAIKGIAARAKRGNHLVSVTTEHRAVLDPLDKLSRRGFEITLVPVDEQGLVDLDRLAEALRDETILVSVMLANNEIGVIQDLAEVGRICRDRGIPLHSDATQAVGKVPLDLQQLPVDLLSFTAHKIYGPKGVGGLFVRRRARLDAQIDGGGQQRGLRSGTLPVPLIVALAQALQLCHEENPSEQDRLAGLRDRLYEQLREQVAGVTLNGPPLKDRGHRLGGNLNVSFADVDGEALLTSLRNIAVSSGSACTSTNPEPSHVLRALGHPDERVRSSLRFGLGRFNTAEEIDFAAAAVAEAVRRLRSLANSV